MRGGGVSRLLDKLDEDLSKQKVAGKKAPAAEEKAEFKAKGEPEPKGEEEKPEKKKGDCPSCKRPY